MELGTEEKLPEANATHTISHNVGTQTNDLQISEAIQMQIEVQRRLHEQLEVQRRLQLRIEAQGKYLQTVLEKAQETLGKQNIGAVGLEDAKVQLSELVSKVSTQRLNSAFSGVQEMSRLCPNQDRNQPNDCSVDSCLTSCEGPLREQEMHNNQHLQLRPCNHGFQMKPMEVEKEPDLVNTDLRWRDDLNAKRRLLSAMEEKTEQLGMEANLSRSLSMSIGLHRDAEMKFLSQSASAGDLVKAENERNSHGFKIPYITSKLDLNSHHQENYSAPRSKQFDLNRVSWS